jgi:ribonuclease D
MSDWDKRPLKPGQLEYAALDAYVLIQIFDKLRECAKEQNALACVDGHAANLIKNKNKVRFFSFQYSIHL